jgi:genome maintenance exonuclease 1
MADVVIDQGLANVNEFWGIEVPLYFPSVYAGTTDGAGIHLNEEAILDYKQTNKPKKREWIEDYFLQLAAYAEAHNDTYGTAINTGVILMCAKPATEHEDPVYQEFVLEPQDYAHWRDQWMRRVELYYLTS